jgi:Asp/Glu/hydantoin racemase
MKAYGGKSVYGAAVGILMLEARFPRIPGDMGNAQTWPFPVLYKVVRDASPDRVVRHQAQGLIENFIQAAQALVADGVDGITTNCGFLALFQDDLSAAIGVPVASSSLMQVPLVDRILPADKRAGILTISSATLTQEHLLKAGCRPDTPVGGTPENGEFTTTILNNLLELDVDLARQENIDAAKSLVIANPQIGAIVLECTNMIPYAADIRDATGLPVFSTYNFITWFQQGLQPRQSF